MVANPACWYTYGMQILSQSILNRPVMSLRTGTKVATTTKAIINPNNLKIEGFYCQDSIEKKKQLILLAQDIRDILPAGLVVNDHDVLAEPHDLVRLKKLLDLNFDLLGKPVVSVSKAKFGKVSDYSTEISTLYVKKLYVSQSVIKNLSGGSLGIDRNQIVEITNRKIVIQDPLQPLKATAPAPAPATVS